MPKKTKKKEKAPDVRVLQKTTKFLPCKLTNEELLRFADEIGTTTQDIATEEARQISLKQELKAKLTQLEARRTVLASMITRKEEHRDVAVEIRLDFGAEECRQIRLDTCEVVGTRAITDEERQEVLDFAGNQQPAETEG